MSIETNIKEHGKLILAVTSTPEKCLKHAITFPLNTNIILHSIRFKYLSRFIYESIQ